MGFPPIAFTQRVQPLQFEGGIDIAFASGEDVILKKLQYYKEGGSDKHMRDIASMIRTSGASFDRMYLDRWSVALRVQPEWYAAKSSVQW
mgnify:CR=1 FL=1